MKLLENNTVNSRRKTSVGGLSSEHCRTSSCIKTNSTEVFLLIYSDGVRKLIYKKAAVGISQAADDDVKTALRPNPPSHL